MNDVLTIAEIERLYDGEWVLLGDPEYSGEDDTEVLRGRVLCHSTNQDHLWEFALRTKPTKSAVVFGGEIPDSGAILIL